MATLHSRPDAAPGAEPDADELLREQLFTWVDIEVRGGFTSQEELLEGLGERVEAETGRAADPGLLEELRAYAQQRFAAQRREEARWRERTVNDRIDRAFEELTSRGILALQNVGCTVSDGWEDVNEAALERQPFPLGAAFFHGQDLERGVAGMGLQLAFAAYGGDEEGRDVESILIGREVCAVLRRHGVETRWDGTVQQRIRIPPFPWRKRRWTRAP